MPFPLLSLPTAFATRFPDLANLHLAIAWIGAVLLVVSLFFLNDAKTDSVKPLRTIHAREGLALLAVGGLFMAFGLYAAVIIVPTAIWRILRREHREYRFLRGHPPLSIRLEK